MDVNAELLARVARDLTANKVIKPAGAKVKKSGSLSTKVPSNIGFNKAGIAASVPAKITIPRMPKLNIFQYGFMYPNKRR